MQSAADALIGTLVSGRYRMRRLLGEGGTGHVYLAEHEALGKPVALKVLRAELSMKPDIVARFRQEALSAARIKHPNVLDVFDFGQLDNGCFFLAMELLEGNDLAQELIRNTTIDPARGVAIALQICRGLAAAHARGVLHRDMKPENVFLLRTQDAEEIVKIVDFGAAELRSTSEEVAATEAAGTIFGTPEYMAPEQALGKDTDLRADAYAVGIMLFEMFTGTVPFTGQTLLGVLAAHLNEPVPDMQAFYPELSISPELDGVIMRALEKDPDQRYQAMSELADALLSTPEASNALTPQSAEG